MPHRCAFGCDVNGIVLHSFPNPDKFPERFKNWVKLVGSELASFSDYEIYKKKRLCDIHFSLEHKNRFNRLNALAVPTINFTGETKPLNDRTVSTSEITTTLSSDDDGSCQLESQSVIHVADNESSNGKPIITTEQHNINKDVNFENNLAALPKSMIKILMEHNYSESSRSIRNTHKNDYLKTKEKQEWLGSKEDNYALDKNVKTMIFRKLLCDVPDSKADECWTEIVNVLNKYRGK